MKFYITELRNIFKKLFFQLKEEKIYLFDLYNDFYLKSSSEKFITHFNKTDDIKLAFSVGKYSEDIAFLKTLFIDPNREPCDVDIQKLGSLLIEIGSHISESNKILNNSATISLDELDQTFNLLMNYLEQWYAEEFYYEKKEDYLLIIPSKNQYKAIYQKHPLDKRFYKKEYISKSIQGLREILKDQDNSTNKKSLKQLGIIISFIGNTINNGK